MQSYLHEINKRLSREHTNVIGLLARFDSFLRAEENRVFSQSTRAAGRQLFLDLKCALETEVPNHFSIEEERLFPLLEENGFQGMVEMLKEDHLIILQQVAELVPTLRRLSVAEEVSADEWNKFRETGMTMANLLSIHAEKEEFGFVPTLEDLIDESQARELLAAYQAIENR